MPAGCQILSPLQTVRTHMILPVPFKAYDDSRGGSLVHLSAATTIIEFRYGLISLRGSSLSETRISPSLSVACTGGKARHPLPYRPRSSSAQGHGALA